jgi:hypothetical protein
MPSGGATGIGQAQIDVALSNFSYRISQAGGFAARRIMPILGVAKESGKFWKFGTEHLQTNIETKRADGDTAKRIAIAYTTDNYVNEEYALKALITDRERVDIDSQLGHEQNVTQTLREQIELGYELRVRDIVHDSSNYTLSNTTVPGVKWNAGPGTTIEKNIDDAKAVIEGNSGITPNTIVIPSLVARPMKRSDELRLLRKETDSSLLINGDLPPVLFGLNVIIPGAIEDIAKFGATSSIQKVWATDKVWIGYVHGTPAPKIVTFGMTFQTNIVGKGADRVKKWRDEDRSGDLLETAVVQSEQIIDEGCGYLYTDVLA